MTKTCFILDELYPADKGGIARLMHNTIHHAKSLDETLEIHVVLARAKSVDPSLWEHFADIATLHYFRPDAEIATALGLSDLEITAIFAKHAVPFLRELRVLDTVLIADQACGGFDHIEIPDHMGLGSIVLQAKRANFAFTQAEITCRIHSSLSAIIMAEPFYHPRNSWLAPRLEMERFALQHADRVVAHLPDIAAFNHSHFGFDDRWAEKVEIEFPPVIWPEAPPPSNQPEPKDFVFTARFQPFKRPALFIKAAITMLDAGTDFAGNFRLISYGYDPDYIDYLRLSVPRRYHDRIRIETNVSAQARAEAIASGIIVQPSNFESLCALAYEVSAQQRPLLLARDCLAFGSDDHWVDQENCLLFDPDPTALAATMEQALHWQPCSMVNTTPDPAYFTKAVQVDTPSKTLTTGLLVGPLSTADEMAVVTSHIAQLEGTVAEVKTFAYAPFEGMNADTHLFTDAAFKGQQWQALARSFGTDSVILCTPAALPDAHFAQQGAQVAKPGTGYSSHSLEAKDKQLILYPGKLNTMSFADPRICPPCLMLHRADLHLLAPADDENLMDRLITRISRAALTLVLGPLPHITEYAFQPSPPLQRQLGYEPEPPWRDGFRWIGTEVKPSTRDTLLKIQPFELAFSGDAPGICSAKSSLILATDAAQAIQLSAKVPVTDHILALTARNESKDCPIMVSLHQAKPADALTLHAEGRNCRLLKPGQSYTMRWGPIWRSTHLTLVISSSKPANVRFDNPILTSRA